MKILEKVFQSKQPRNEDMRNLHKDFRTTEDGFWYLNKRYQIYERNINLKVVFKFDDAALLNNCPFKAKIGINESEGPKYFGVAYGTEKDRTQLENWAKKFPWAHLILDLGEGAVAKEGAEEIDLKTSA